MPHNTGCWPSSPCMPPKPPPFPNTVGSRLTRQDIEYGKGSTPPSMRPDLPPRRPAVLSIPSPNQQISGIRSSLSRDSPTSGGPSYEQLLVELKLVQTRRKNSVCSSDERTSNETSLSGETPSSVSGSEEDVWKVRTMKKGPKKVRFDERPPSVEPPNRPLPVALPSPLVSPTEASTPERKTPIILATFNYPFVKLEKYPGEGASQDIDESPTETDPPESVLSSSIGSELDRIGGVIQDTTDPLDAFTELTNLLEESIREMALIDRDRNLTLKPQKMNANPERVVTLSDGCGNIVIENQKMQAKFFELPCPEGMPALERPRGLHLRSSHEVHKSNPRFDQINSVPRKADPVPVEYSQYSEDSKSVSEFNSNESNLVDLLDIFQRSRYRNRLLAQEENLTWDVKDPSKLTSYLEAKTVPVEVIPSCRSPVPTANFLTTEARQTNLVRKPPNSLDTFRIPATLSPQNSPMNPEKKTFESERLSPRDGKRIITTHSFDSVGSTLENAQFDTRPELPNVKLLMPLKTQQNPKMAPSTSSLSSTSLSSPPLSPKSVSSCESSVDLKASMGNSMKNLWKFNFPAGVERQNDIRFLESGPTDPIRNMARQARLKNLELSGMAYEPNEVEAVSSPIYGNQRFPNTTATTQRPPLRRTGSFNESPMTETEFDTDGYWRKPVRRAGSFKSSGGRPNKPPSFEASQDWYWSEELPRGSGCDPKSGTLAPWFHDHLVAFYTEHSLTSCEPLSSPCPREIVYAGGSSFQRRI